MRIILRGHSGASVPGNVWKFWGIRSHWKNVVNNLVETTTEEEVGQHALSITALWGRAGGIWWGCLPHGGSREPDRLLETREVGICMELWVSVSRVQALGQKATTEPLCDPRERARSLLWHLLVVYNKKKQLPRGYGRCHHRNNIKCHYAARGSNAGISVFRKQF